MKYTSVDNIIDDLILRIGKTVTEDGNTNEKEFEKLKELTLYDFAPRAYVYNPSLLGTRTPLLVEAIIPGRLLKQGEKTMIVIPAFRAAGATYVFLMDPETGSLARVIYPAGQTAAAPKTRMETDRDDSGANESRACPRSSSKRSVAR